MPVQMCVTLRKIQKILQEDNKRKKGLKRQVKVDVVNDSSYGKAKKNLLSYISSCNFVSRNLNRSIFILLFKISSSNVQNTKKVPNPILW